MIDGDSATNDRNSDARSASRRRGLPIGLRSSVLTLVLAAPNCQVRGFTMHCLDLGDREYLLLQPLDVRGKTYGKTIEHDLVALL